jgi:CBS domain-containing protein
VIVHLSELLRLPLSTAAGETVGPLKDVVVRLRVGGYPLVIGLVTRVGSGQLFVHTAQLTQLDDRAVVLGSDRLDLRGFERRDGELLLRTDILGHRLIDAEAAELRRAYDVELRPSAEGLVVSCLDTRRPAHLFGLVARGAGHPCRDWKVFEPLIGRSPSVRRRGGFLRVHKMKAAQIADLLEQANRVEGREILEHVHTDPELEADVFEELEPEIATRLFGDRSDEQVADVLSRMGADDAADAVAELPQQRREAVLEAMPLALRTKVLTLMGFNPESAGGVMNLDVLTVSVDATVGEALVAVAQAISVQPEALNTVHAVDAQGRLAGVISLVTLVQGDPLHPLGDILDTEPVRVGPDTDIVDVALLMADYNLVAVPVVDEQRRLLGVITFDDVLEATIPGNWRRRERPQHPDAEDAEGTEAAS